MKVYGSAFEAGSWAEAIARVQEQERALAAADVSRTPGPNPSNSSSSEATRNSHGVPSCLWTSIGIIVAALALAFAMAYGLITAFPPAGMGSAVVPSMVPSLGFAVAKVAPARVDDDEDAYYRSLFAAFVRFAKAMERRQQAPPQQALPSQQARATKEVTKVTKVPTTTKIPTTPKQRAVAVARV